MSVESNPELHFFSLRSVIGSGYLRHFLNQSDAKLKKIFQRLRQFGRFHFGFSLALEDIFLYSYWPKSPQTATG